MARKPSRPSRPQANRPVRPKIKIICEGKETEPNYLQDLLALERIRSAEVHIIRGLCSPISIIRRAIKESSKLNNIHPDDSIWAVFDRDTHSDFNAAVALAQQYNIKVIASNPCFELWIILHFVNQHAQLSTQHALDLTNKTITIYKKNISSIYSKILRNNTNDAIRRAEFLDIQAQRNGNIFDNPTTKVFQLVKFLLLHRGN